MAAIAIFLGQAAIKFAYKAAEKDKIGIVIGVKIGLLNRVFLIFCWLWGGVECGAKIKFLQSGDLS